jgi:undecaprenyl-diphosphatase
VSSSGHLVLVPNLLGWQYGRLDPELRKSFEVALHAGTAAALLIALRAEVAEVLLELDVRRVLHHALSAAPAAVAALAFERPIERRLGAIRSVAVAQVAAGALLAVADRAPAVRNHSEASDLDYLLVGVGQAAALAPGVSRNGAALTAARVRRFERRAANRIARHAALPVIVGAACLKGFRLWRRGLEPELVVPFAVGATAAFASTLASRGLVRRLDDARSYAPLAAYRMALGAAALARRAGGR